MCRWRRLGAGLSLPLWAALVTAPASADGTPVTDGAVQARSAPAHAVIVLVGPAAQHPELAPLLSEFLARAGVRVRFQLQPSFEPSDLWAQSDADSAVGVFVTGSGERAARLYFRGPFGQRFLARDLTLPGGLDEVGRETIANVVEASTLALLHSEAGLDRKAAEAAFRPAEPRATGTRPTATRSLAAPQVTLPKRRSRIEYELAARGVSSWAGAALGVALGAGAEIGRRVRSGGWFFHRERLAYEYLAPSSFRSETVGGRLAGMALRAGVDLGALRENHAVLAGLSGGVDIIRISSRQLEPGWTISPPSTSVVPVLRTELRYELSFADLLLAAAVFTDLTLADTHYDVRDGGVNRRAVEPWTLRPGLALTVGWQSRLF